MNAGAALLVVVWMISLSSMTYQMVSSDNCKVPLDMIIGEENGGWGLITEQLNHERVGLAAWGIQGWKLFRDALDWARNTRGANGERVIDERTIETSRAAGGEVTRDGADRRQQRDRPHRDRRRDGHAERSGLLRSLRDPGDRSRDRLAGSRIDRDR